MAKLTGANGKTSYGYWDKMAGNLVISDLPPEVAPEHYVSSKPAKKRGNSKKPDLPGPDMFMKQICTGTWKDTYSLFGLDKSGAVWRYDYDCGGWIPYCMKAAQCEHRR